MDGIGLQAASPEEKAHAVQEGAKRVLKTLEWNKKRRFMSNAQLKEWHHLVSSHTDRTIFWQRYNDCETATRNSLEGSDMLLDEMM